MCVCVFLAQLKLAVECWLCLPCCKFRTYLNTIISIHVGKHREIKTTTKKKKKHFANAHWVNLYMWKRVCVYLDFNALKFYCSILSASWIRYSSWVFIILIKQIYRYVEVNDCHTTWSNYNGYKQTCTQFESISVVAVTPIWKKQTKSTTTKLLFKYDTKNTLDVCNFFVVFVVVFNDSVDFVKLLFFPILKQYTEKTDKQAE